MRLEAPNPGATLEVPVNIPGEREATDAAVNYGWVIAMVIIILLVGSLAAWLWRQPVLRILGAAVIAGYIVYLVMK